MKYLLIFALTVGLVACTTDSPSEEKPASTLILSTDQINLSEASPIDSAIVKLSCGCGFSLVVESFSGDTSVIGYETREVEDLTAKTMAIVFRPNSGASAGNYSAKLAFLSTGSKGKFRDTIRVSYAK